MTTLNLKTLAAGLDDTFEWWGNQDSITVCRWYGQKLLRQATYWEPAEYTEETSEDITVKAEGSIVIILDDAGKELDREDFSEYHEEDHAGILADMIDAQIPWRDLQKEADEAYGEWLIDPDDIEVKTRGAGDPEAGSQADVQTVTNSLNGGTSVTIQTANLTGPNDNSITVSDAITKTTGGDATLSLKATGSVNINADITSTAGKLNVDITSDTNHRAGGSVSVATGKNIKTLGGNVKIGGGLVEDGVGFANSQSAGEAGITLNGVTIDTTDGTTASGNV